MPDETNDTLRWSHGTPLRQAPQRFGDPDQVRAHVETDHAALVTDALKGIFQSISPKEPSDPKAVEAQKALAASSRRQFALRKDIVDRLKAGELVGVGYNVPRRAGDAPSIIPVDVWDGAVRWERDEVEGAGCKFAAVRICEAVDQAAKRRGRPSLQPAIEAAFAAMLKDGSVDLDGSVKDQVAAVRERIWIMNPGLNRSPRGLADKTLEMALSPLFDHARARR